MEHSLPGWPNGCPSRTTGESHSQHAQQWPHWRKEDLRFSTNLVLYLQRKVHASYYGITAKQVSRIVKQCMACTQSKPISGADHVQPIHSKEIFERVVADLKDFSSITPDDAPRYLLSFVDHYSSFVSTYCLFTKTTAEVWTCFTDYAMRYRVPDLVHTDNGGEFQWYELCTLV
jgi:hypothetical protein